MKTAMIVFVSCSGYAGEMEYMKERQKMQDALDDLLVLTNEATNRYGELFSLWEIVSEDGEIVFKHKVK